MKLQLVPALAVVEDARPMPRTWADVVVVGAPSDRELPCSIPRCPKYRHTGGLCTGHYRARTSGRPPRPLAGRSTTARPCRGEGCIRRVRADGLCNSHYQRREAGHPDPLGPLRVYRQDGEAEHYTHLSLPPHVREVVEAMRPRGVSKNAWAARLLEQWAATVERPEQEKWKRGRWE